MASSKDDNKQWVDTTTTTSSPVDEAAKFNSAISTTGYGARETIANESGSVEDDVEGSGGDWFAYLKTRNFYIVLALGWVNLFSGFASDSCH